MDEDKGFKVIIVDDEPIILRSLQMVIPWDELGLQLCGTARNGEEALELVQRDEPDIIISDIRMPSIDGITLMRLVMEQYPDTLFIILSGYGEFEYAREAIRHGAFNYLLKPIDHDELRDVLVQARDSVLQQRHRLQEHEVLRRSVQSLASIVRERMFSSFIEGTDSPEVNQSFWLDEWELRRPYHMGLVNLDDYESVIASWRVEERSLWYFAISNILHEYLLARRCFTVFPYHNGEWLFIMQDTDEQTMQDIGRELIETIKRCTKLSVSVAISRRFEHISKLQISYQSCRRALARRFTSGKEMVYVDRDDETRGESSHNEQVGLVYPLLLEKALSDSLRTLDWQAFDANMQRLQENLAASRASRQHVSHILIQLVIVLHRHLEAFHRMHHMNLEWLLQRLTSLTTLEEMIHEVRSSFHEWGRRALDQGNRVDPQMIVRQVLDYVERHYHEDLGIDEVADVVGLSCSHFCVLFKQETGFTFLEYLTKYRIDKACSILRNSEVKVYQIAPLVGYQDPRYFTQVFKKVVGKTPSEYRLAQIS